MKKYNSYKLLQLILLFIVSLNLHYSSTAIAQEVTKNGTQISDNTAPNALNPLTFSILELNSKERGFLMPRMSTAERMRIPTKELTAGMIIYNTSIDCIEFYNTTRMEWMSACGDLEPAIFSIPDDKCISTKVSGEYIEGVFLDSRKNVIAVEVNVSSSGTYNIEAIAYDNKGKLNGYTFTAEGVFPTEGSFTVILKGNGTPEKGYPIQVDGTPIAKDKIKFLLNNVETNCTIENKVSTKALSYNLVEVIQTGEFFTKVNVLNPKTTGKIQVKINNISQAGVVEINTAIINGISFYGSKVLTASEVINKTATIDLTASGVTTLPLNLSYDFISNSYVKLEHGELQNKIPKVVVVSPVNVTSDCGNLTINKEFKKGEALTAENMITIPVKVIATGRGRIVGTVATNSEQTKLIQYSSDTIDFVFNGATNDEIFVELKPLEGTGIPTVGGKDIVMKIQLESTGAKEYDNTQTDEKIIKDICNLNIAVKDSWAEIDTRDITATFYSVNHSKSDKKQYNGLESGKPTPYIPPYREMNENGDERFRVGLTGIVPHTIGKWEFETQEFNGVIFKGKGEFFEGDLNKPQTVFLKAYGKAGSDKKAQVIEVYNNRYPGVGVISNSLKNKRLEVDYVYQPMVIYSIGGTESWHPGGRNSWGYAGAPQLIRSKNNFSFNGIVRIDDLSILGVTDEKGVNSEKDIEVYEFAGQFKNNLNDSHIVFIGAKGGNIVLKKQELQIKYLADAVKEKTVALIYGEGDETPMKLFLTHLTGDNNVMMTKGTSNKYVSTPYYMGNSLSNSLIWGDGITYFGSAYGGVSLNNKSIHGSSYGSGRTFTINHLPNDYIGIAGANSTNLQENVFAFMHKTYGFVGVNNQGFMGGERLSGSGDQGKSGFPSSSMPDGTPLTSKNNLNDNIIGYTSWFLLNLTHWAIDYIQKNNPNFQK